jgi:hypothetical protein
VKRRHRNLHPWLWLLTAGASTAILIAALAGRTDPTPDQPTPARAGSNP